MSNRKNFIALPGNKVSNCRSRTSINYREWNKHQQCFESRVCLICHIDALAPSDFPQSVQFFVHQQSYTLFEIGWKVSWQPTFNPQYGKFKCFKENGNVIPPWIDRWSNVCTYHSPFQVYWRLHTSTIWMNCIFQGSHFFEWWYFHDFSRFLYKFPGIFSLFLKYDFQVVFEYK